MTSSVMNLHNLDVTEFLELLDVCEGNIYLITREGDKLNLKSRLSQLAGLTRLIEGGRISEASVLCDSIEDERRLFRLNMFGESVKTARAS